MFKSEKHIYQSYSLDSGDFQFVDDNANDTQDFAPCEQSCSLRVDPLFKRRKGLRNNEQKLATATRVIILNYPNPLFK